jgi:hypothetical protein
MDNTSTSSKIRELRSQRREIPREELDKTRTYLLLCATIGYVCSITGEVPTEIETLGVRFSEEVDTYLFFGLIGLIVLYFTVKFYLKRVEWNAAVKEYEDPIHEEREKNNLPPPIPPRNPGSKALVHVAVAISVWMRGDCFVYCFVRVQGILSGRVYATGAGF